MKLFNKAQLYSIIAEEEANFKVQHFADEHCVKNSKIYVQSDGEVIMIDFYSKETRENLVAELRKELESNFNVKIAEHFIYVTKKES